MPPWADREAPWADAESVIVPPTIIVTLAVPADPNIDALGLGQISERASCQHQHGCRHDENDLSFGASSSWASYEIQRGRKMLVPLAPPEWPEFTRRGQMEPFVERGAVESC